jgi:fluoride exporter
MSIVLWTAVVLIGGAGSVLRFLADGAVAGAADRDFPLGTLAVNVSGAVILGLLTGLALGHDEALLAGTAAVGSYTTFSTWMLETQRLASRAAGPPWRRDSRSVRSRGAEWQGGGVSGVVRAPWSPSRVPMRPFHGQRARLLRE